MSETLQSLGFGEPRSVDIADLEAELSRLWRSATEDPETTHAVTRACALTLLVYVESEDAGREALNLIGKVTLQNPCRAVVMIAEPQGTPPGMAARISAHCHLPAPGEKQVCCEQIVVSARGEAVNDLDKVVIPLTVPGLPVVFWWRAASPLPQQSFHQILRRTDRVLVDSGRFSRPEVDLGSLAGEVQKSSRDLSFSDLNWARITAWRQLLADCFGSLQMRPYLHRLGEISIEYEQRGAEEVGPFAQALLLTAWLASRLKWEPIYQPLEPGMRSAGFDFQSGGTRIQVRLARRLREGQGDLGLASIVGKSAGPPSATCALVRGIEGRCVVVRSEISGRPPLERTVCLEVPDEVELVNEELKVAGGDRVYEEALHMVARMVAR